jgi:signal transduction histidine kinase
VTDPTGSDCGTAADRADRWLRRPWLATLAALATSVLTSLVMPGVGLVRETATGWIVLGSAGVVLFAGAQTAVLYAAVTPWLDDRTRRWARCGFAAAVLLSVPLVAPVAIGEWLTWSWLGASVVGTVPVLLRRPVAASVAVATVLVSALLAVATGGSVRDAVIITGGVGLGVAAVNVLQVWFWDLLLRAQHGRTAQAKLAAVEERLRFAADVHDLLGHNLSVIALKAELAARLVGTDPPRARQEAAQAQQLAAAALTELRRAVYGYRAVDLPVQLAAIAQVLESSGVRCTVTAVVDGTVSAVPGELPQSVAGALAATAREGGTNVLRHSRASWCRISLRRDAAGLRFTMVNDGVPGRPVRDDLHRAGGGAGAGGDQYSFGLRGLAERLVGLGGEVRTGTDGEIFTLEASVPLPSDGGEPG